MPALLRFLPLTTGGGGGSPTGPAGGDLGGTYPNPSVLKVNGAAANEVPLVLRGVFTYLTPTPLDFGTLAAGDEVISSDVILDVPFDDPTAVLTLGLVSSPGSILNSAEINPLAASTYNSGAATLVAGPNQLRLQIVPGASTQGSGRAVVTIRKA